VALFGSHSKTMVNFVSLVMGYENDYNLLLLALLLVCRRNYSNGGPPKFKKMFQARE